MNKIYLPSLRVVPNSTCACDTYQMIDRNNHPAYRNHFFGKSNTDPCENKSSVANSSVWYRLYRTPTGSSYRHSRSYNKIDFPNNNLDFRLQTCYDHAQETFASKARIVVQPITICQLNSHQTANYSFKIVNQNRKEHFNEATKGQHIASDHFANGKHGYSRVVAGAISVD